LNQNEIIQIKTQIEEITESTIKKYLDRIQGIVDSHAIKIKTAFDGKLLDTAQVEKASNELKAIITKMAADINSRLTETFGIDDERTLKKLQNISSQWVQLRDTINEGDAKAILFDKVYESIQKFDSYINHSEDIWRGFVDHVNSSKINMPSFGDMEEFQRMRREMGVGVVSPQGIGIDVWWKEAQELFPHIIKDTVTSTEEMFTALHELVQRGREELRNQTISSEELQEIFGGKQGIKNALDDILAEVPDIEDVRLILPIELTGDVETDEIITAINQVQTQLDGLSDDEKNIPLSFNFDDVDIMKTVETIDSATGTTVAKMTELSEGVGKVRQVFESVNAETGDLEQTIEKIIDTTGRLTEQFQKKIGQEINIGVTIDNIESDIRAAIHSISGFEEANTRALKSVQDGNNVLQQYAISVTTADNNFKNYVLSIDETTNKSYLLEKGISSVDSAMSRMGEQIKFVQRFGEALEGIILPTNVGEVDLSNSIRNIEGFENAYVKMIGTTKHGTHEMQQAFVVTNNTAGGFNQFKLSVDQSNGSVSILNQGLKSTNIALEKTVDSVNTLAEVIAVAGISKGLKEVKALLWDCVEASVAFESSMIELNKKTSFTAEELKEVRQEILNIANELPFSLSEIMAVSAAVGQIGVSEKNLMSFTRTMLDVGAATTLSAEEAVLVFGRYSNIVQMAEEDVEKLASSVSKLGNNYAASESQIMDLMLRLGSAGRQANLTDAQIAGLAAGLGSLGVTAELGGNQFSLFMNRVNLAVNTGNKDLENFAEVAGMTAEEFKYAFETDAVNAIISFTEGLSDIDKHSKNTIQLLDELGFRNIRVADVLRRVSGSGELLRSAIEMSSNEWETHLALTTEANLKYSSMESKMQLLTNSTDQLKIAVGDSLTPALGVAVDGLKDTNLELAKFLKENPHIVRALTVLSVAIGTMTTSITLAAIAKRALSASAKALSVDLIKTSTGATNVAATFKATTAAAVVKHKTMLLLSGSLALVAGAATVLAMAIAEHNRKQSEAKQKVIELNNELKNQISIFNSLKSRIKDEGISRDSLISIMSNHNEKYRDELEAIKDVNELRERSIQLLQEESRQRAEDTIRELGSEYIKQEKFLNSKYNIDYGSLIPTYYNTPEDALNMYIEKIDALNKKIADGEALSFTEKQHLEAYTNRYLKLAEKIKHAKDTLEIYETAQSILNGTFVSSAKSTNEFEDSLDGLSSGLSGVSSAAGKASEALKELQKSQDKLNKAQREMAATGGLSASTVFTFMEELGEDYLNYLYTENGQIRLNIEAYKEWANSRTQANIDVLESTKTRLESEKQLLENEKKILENNIIEAQIIINEGPGNEGQDLQFDAWLRAKKELEDYNSTLNEVELNLSGVIENLKLNNAELEMQSALFNNIGESGFEQERKALERDFEERILTAKEYYDELEKLRRKYYENGTKISNEIAKANEKAFSDALDREIKDKIAAFELY